MQTRDPTTRETKYSSKGEKTILPTKEEEITRTEASFLGGTKLERGQHSGSSPDSHLASLPIF
jgi:hypothetical protein